MLVNLTPHDLVLQVGDGTRRVLPCDHQPPARVATTDVPVGLEDGIPVAARRLGDVAGLPGPRLGVRYVVSLPTLLAAAHLGRRDLLAPDTGTGAVRDEGGNIVAVRGLVELAEPTEPTAAERLATRLRSLVGNLDRCEHGRHVGDICSGCDGPSHGNPHADADGV